MRNCLCAKFVLRFIESVCDAKVSPASPQMCVRCERVVVFSRCFVFETRLKDEVHCILAYFKILCMYQGSSRSASLKLFSSFTSPWKAYPFPLFLPQMLLGIC